MRSHDLKVTDLALKGLVAEWPAEDRERLDRVKSSLYKIVNEAGMIGQVAVAMIGVELASKDPIVLVPDCRAEVYK